MKTTTSLPFDTTIAVASVETLAETVARLTAENQALRSSKAQAGNPIKVSVKGAVSVYGFGQWPVTLYKSQWEKLFAMVDDIKAFIAANDAKLSVKPPKA